MPALRQPQLSNLPVKPYHASRVNSILNKLREEMDPQLDMLADPEIPILVNQQTAQLLSYIARSNFNFSV